MLWTCTILQAIPPELFDTSFKAALSPWNSTRNRFPLVVGISCSIKATNKLTGEILLETTEGGAELNTFSLVFDKEVRVKSFCVQTIWPVDCACRLLLMRRYSLKFRSGHVHNCQRRVLKALSSNLEYHVMIFAIFPPVGMDHYVSKKCQINHLSFP